MDGRKQIQFRDRKRSGGPPRSEHLSSLSMRDHFARLMKWLRAKGMTELRAVTAESREVRDEAFRRWRDASALIAGIHGRLQCTPVSVTHAEEETLMIPDSSFNPLAQIRRDADKARSSLICDMPNTEVA